MYFPSVFDVVNLASFRRLSDNKIGDDGAIGLGKHLQTNTSLTTLEYVLSNQPQTARFNS